MDRRLERPRPGARFVALRGGFGVHLSAGGRAARPRRRHDPDEGGAARLFRGRAGPRHGPAFRAPRRAARGR